MYSQRIILNSEVQQDDLKTVIALKTVAWPYSYDKQVEWLKANLNDFDYHFILYRYNEPVAYLNLINEVVELDGTQNPILGVGNVCTFKQGLGWGKELLLRANDFILGKKIAGLLFCKDTLIKFYEKNSWTLVERNKLNIPPISDKINTMTFNLNSEYHSLAYKGRAF